MVLDQLVVSNALSVAKIRCFAAAQEISDATSVVNNFDEGLGYYQQLGSHHTNRLFVVGYF